MKLLKDILEAWKAEVEKKPPTMSLEQAYETLNLAKGQGGSVLALPLCSILIHHLMCSNI